MQISSGSVIVFLNQDALPLSESWLADLTRPLFDSEGPEATQGTILDGDDEAFFWGTNGARHHFTAESRRWIKAHHGIGFSTVCCAMRRPAWEEEPFRDIRILEDKYWQSRARAKGWRIELVGAEVAHSHHHTWHSVVARAFEEGRGWRLVGERYTLRDTVRDVLSPGRWSEVFAGVVKGRVRSGLELGFTILRPICLYLGGKVESRA